MLRDLTKLLLLFFIGAGLPAAQAQSAGDIDFAVDMNQYINPFTTVYVSGSFNGWNGTANALDDSDMDGIWTGTINLPAGNQEFKFTIDDWAAQESFEGGESCTITDPSGQFINRLVVVDGNATLDTFCFNSCDACGPAMAGNVTVSVDMNMYAASFTTVYISGTFNGWNGTSNPLDDSDMDGVWSGTVMMPAGNNEYKFTLDDWSVQENFAGGESCTITDPSGQFVNRLVAVNGDATVETVCWNSCEDCSSALDNPTVPITFEDGGINYTGAGFGGCTPSAATNPDQSGDNTSMNVWQLDKMEGSEVWAGASHTLASPIDLGTSSGSEFELKFWSPRANIPVLLKFEVIGGADFPEVADTVTEANTWVTLTYDMSEHPNYDAGAAYNLVAVFPDFGTSGPMGGETFYVDDIDHATTVGLDPVERSLVELKTFPNPVSGLVNVAFRTPVSGTVKFSVVDILGRELTTLNMGQVQEGYYTERINLSGLSSGVHKLIMKIDGEIVRTESMLVK